MTEAGERKDAGSDPAAGSFWVQFDRELAEINAVLTRLEQSLPKPSPGTPVAPEVRAQPRRRQRKPRAAKPQPTTEPSAADAPPPAESAAPAQPETPAAAAEPLPTGTDLADPKNFGLLPPVANLEQGSVSAEDYRKRLGQDLAFANKVLHTSRVPAPVWREWRAFERAAQEKLRALTGLPG